MEFTLLGAAAIAGAAAYLMLRWEAVHGNTDRTDGDVWEIGVVSAVAGIFIGRIIAMLIDGVNPIAHPLDIILVRSGISTAGAALGAAVLFFWQSRKQPVAMADAISAAALAGLSGWAAGCLIRGTCLGTATDLPWGMSQAGSTVTRHPVGLYAAILFAVAAIALAAWKAYGRPSAGVPASVAVIAAAGIRLATEPFRPSISGGPVWFYAASLVAGLVGVVWFGIVAPKRASSSG